MAPRFVMSGPRAVALGPLSPVAGENGGRACSDKRHALFLLFLIVIACWQSCVVGTHFHGRAQSSVAATGSTTLAQRPPIDRRGPGPADNCPLCQEAAIAGVYIEPGPIALPQPSAIIAWYHQAGSLLSIGGQRSHGWRSRAPPKISSPD